MKTKIRQQLAQRKRRIQRRLDKFDLPLGVLVVTATNGKLEARSLKLSNHKLLAANPK